jgi:hypothetical protein
MFYLDAATANLFIGRRVKPIPLLHLQHAIQITLASAMDAGYKSGFHPDDALPYERQG